MISSLEALGQSVRRRGTGRLIVAAYWLCGLVIGGVDCWSELARPHNANFERRLIPLEMAFFLPTVLGGIRVSGLVKPFRGILLAPLTVRDDEKSPWGELLLIDRWMRAADAELEEREARIGYRVHFIGYNRARLGAFALFVVWAACGLVNLQWLSRVATPCFLLLAFTLWSLPQTLILWNEPDLEEEA